MSLHICLLDSSPTLKQLKLMKIRSGKIKITERLCTEWKTIGHLLDFDDYDNEVLKIEKQTKDMEDCVTQVLSLWLQGRSRAYKACNMEDIY